MTNDTVFLETLVNYDVDVFGKPVNQTPTLRERCTTFERDVLAPHGNTEEFILNECCKRGLNSASPGQFQCPANLVLIKLLL